MALTRDYKETVQRRLNNDPEFARALLLEAVELMLGGDAETARLILRDLVNATLGFERLAAEMQKSSKSLHRMLSLSGNPTMSNLTDIFVTLQKVAGLDLQSSNLPTEVMGSFSEDMSLYKAFEFAGEYCRAIDSGVALHCESSTKAQRVFEKDAIGAFYSYHQDDFDFKRAS